MQSSATKEPLARQLKRLCRRHDVSGFLFVLPAIILLGIFMIYPLIASFWLSLTKYNIVKPPVFIGLANFYELFSDPVFIIALRNTLAYTAVVVPGCIIFPLLLALLLNRSIRGITFFRSIIYLPVITAMPIAGIMWKILYSQQGFINGFIQWAGLRKTPIGFLSDPSVALLSIIFVTIWKASGYYMMLYLGGLQTIPVELDEAATVDGANAFQRFWNVTLPLLKPTMVLVVILSAIGALKVFGEVYVMTGGGPADSTNVIVHYIYRQAFVFLRMGYASAMGVVLFVLLFAFSFAYLRHMEGQYTTY